MPPWYQACTSMSRPGTGMSETVVRYAVFAVALGGRQLVVARKAQLVVLQTKNRISTPFVRIVRSAARACSAAPLVGEHNFFPIVRKRGRVPVRIIWIVYRVQTLRMNRIGNVQQNSVSGTGASGAAIAEYAVMSWHWSLSDGLVIPSLLCVPALFRR